MSKDMVNSTEATWSVGARVSRRRAVWAGVGAVVIAVVASVLPAGVSGAQAPGEPVFADPLPAGATVSVGDVVDLSGSGCPAEGPLPLPAGWTAMWIVVDDAVDSPLYPVWMDGQLGASAPTTSPGTRTLLSPSPDAAGVWSASVTVDPTWGAGRGDLMVTAICWTLLELDGSGEALDPASIERALFEFGPVWFVDPSSTTTSSSTTTVPSSTTSVPVAAQPVVVRARYTG
jgi:hypothetical protein